MTINLHQLNARIARAQSKLSPEPKPNPFEGMTSEELHALALEYLIKIKKTMREYQFSDNELLRFPEIRQHAKSGHEPWLNNENHRIGVFNTWLGLLSNREDLKNHPDVEGLWSIIGRGWYDGYMLEPEDIAFCLATCRIIELDGEQPWLKEYLGEVGGGRVFR